MSEKQSAILGWIGTLLSVIMYVSYVPQIINNLHGMKGTPIQPLAAAVNCYHLGNLFSHKEES